MSSLQNFNHNNSTAQLKKELAEATNWSSFNHISSEQHIQYPVFNNNNGPPSHQLVNNKLIVDNSGEPSNSYKLTSEDDASRHQFNKDASRNMNNPYHNFYQQPLEKVTSSQGIATQDQLVYQPTVKDIHQLVNLSDQQKMLLI